MIVMAFRKKYFRLKYLKEKLSRNTHAYSGKAVIIMNF